MKVLGCYFIRGATAWEVQVGRAWFRLLRPRFRTRRTWPWFRFTWIGRD